MSYRTEQAKDSIPEYERRIAELQTKNQALFEDFAYADTDRQKAEARAERYRAALEEEVRARWRLAPTDGFYYPNGRCRVCIREGGEHAETCTVPLLTRTAKPVEVQP